MIIDLTSCIDLQTAGMAQENLAKAKSGHLGTHFDVMDKVFSIDYMELPAVVFDVSGIGTEREIGIDDIDLSLVPKGGFVAFASGFIEKVGYGTKEYFTFHPYLSMELINALLDRNVAIIAVDFSGLRNGKEHHPVDMLCASRNTFVVENICNLSTVLGGRQHAFFTAGTYPVNFVGQTGLPCRVVAHIETITESKSMEIADHLEKQDGTWKVLHEHTSPAQGRDGKIEKNHACWHK